MIHAYDESYLNDAMNNLGEAVDYAVNCCHLTIDEFFDYFIASPFARQFERGVPKAIAGLSGSELVLDVLHQAGLDSIVSETQIEYEYSPEYWCGWILAYYQWYTTRTFSNIRQQIPLQKIYSLYSTHHEASVDKFVVTVNAYIRKQNLPTRLQQQRKISGYSQKELSKKSKVSLRSIQQYEQRVKDINKASVSNIMSLAIVLGVQVEDIIEYDTSEII